MENFNTIFTLIAENESIRLNTNILESGVINIFSLLIILIYTGKDFLGSLLKERKIIIVKSVQDAEDRLNEAKTRLIEAKKQLNQAYIVINEIRDETIATKKILLKSDAFEAKKDLKIRFERALSYFRSKERQIFLEIKQQIIVLVLKETFRRSKEFFKYRWMDVSLNRNCPANILISKIINQLEGNLL